MNHTLIAQIKEQAHIFNNNIIADRRHLHAHPELSFQEFNTSAYIQQQLKELGIGYREIAQTGVLAEIKGSKGNGPVIALRADMDALPIREENDIDYKSVNEGVMHACGHDAHTAILLGAARILNAIKDEFAGTVRLIFQPAEEKLPGGAQQMIAEGALDNPQPVHVIGQHVYPHKLAGKVTIPKGLCMASMDEITVTITGKGGHGAMPHTTIDPVHIAAQMIVALQQLVSRMANPQMPTVLSFGRFIADGAINIIPNTVYLEGTFRTFNDEWRYEAHERMKKLAVSLVEGMGATCQFDIRCGYPSVNNDEQLSDAMNAYAKEYIGEENVEHMDNLMAAEDFAYYGRHKPSVFYFLGVGNEAMNITSPLHSPTFNLDETALETGAGLMAYFATRILQQSSVTSA